MQSLKKLLILLGLMLLHPAYAEDYISYFNKAEQAAKAKQFDRAIDLYFKAINLTPKSKVEDSDLILNNLGVTYMNVGDQALKAKGFQKALFNYEQALKILNKLTNKENDNISIAQDNIAFTYHQLGKESANPDEALNYYQKAQQGYHKSSSSSKDENLIYLLNDMVYTYIQKKDFNKAESLTKESLNKSIKKFSELHQLSAIEYHNLGYLYEIQNRKSDAFNYYMKALKIREKVLGLNDKATALSYNKIGELYYIEGNYDKALEYFGVSLRATEKGSGINNANALSTYSYMGNIYSDKGMLDKSKNYHEMSLEIRKNLYGLTDLKTAVGYNNLANIYYKMAKFSEAVDYHSKALEIKINNPQTTEIDLAYSYNGKANVYNALDNHTEAITFYKKALKTFEKELKIHQDTAILYSNLAISYIDLNNFTEAKSYNKKALEMRKKLFGNKPHPFIAMNHNTFGLIYDHLGDNKNAIASYEKAITMKQALGQTRDEDTSVIYNNIANIYLKLAAYNEALVEFEKAKKILEELDFEHPNLETIYENMGYIYQKLNNQSKELEYQQKALKLRKKVYGLNHPSVALSYNAIGDIYIRNKQPSKALRYYQNALDIGKKTFGLNHPFVAKCYTNIAHIDLQKGEYKKARRGYQNAYTVLKDNFGKTHPSLIDASLNLGIACSFMNDFEKNYALNKKAFELYHHYRLNNFSLLDDQQKLNYSQANQYYISSLFYAATEYKKSLKKKSHKEVDYFVFNNWLNYKRSIFDLENTLKIILQRSDNNVINEMIQELFSHQKRLAKLYQESGNYENIQSYKKDIQKLENEISKLQIKLSQNIASYQKELNLKDITYQEISKYLKPNELYIDFARMQNNYYYFTLDKQQNVTFHQVDNTQSQFIDETIKSIQSETQKIISGKTFADLEVAQKAYGKLYDAIINSLPLNDKTSLVISPDGLLNLIPFEAFYNQKEQNYLVKHFTIQYIPSGKEFIRLHQQKNTLNEKIAVFSDPNFGMQDKIQEKTNVFRRGTVDALYTQAKTLNRTKNLFDSLPGSISEAKNIDKLFKDTQLYTGNQATENKLFNLNAPKILHLSTHGFFIRDKAILNPMLKSGIALSGANYAIQTKTGNGIVTALELTGTNLNGTELVVLSACETGIGKIEEAEGISGINKAFMQAGAKHIVMSLWSVSDKATAKLMEKFYENIQKGNKYSDALQKAKLSMIENENSHPFFWSGFIGSGI